MVARYENTLRAPSAVERFVKQLNIAYKAVRLYPPASAIPRESASSVVSTLRTILREEAGMVLAVTEDGLFCENAAVQPGHEAYEAFAREFSARHLADVRFHAGVTAVEVIEFLRVLDLPLEDIRDGGEFESRLWDASVVSITVTPSNSERAEAGVLPDRMALPEEEAWPPTAERVDELIAGAFGGRPRAQRLLVRVVDDPDLVGAYLREAVSRGGTTPGALRVANRIAAFAHALENEPADERDQHFKVITEGLMRLDPDLRRHVLGEALLPNARHDDILAELVRRLALRDVCETLASGIEETPASREGFARALRNVVLIGCSDRQELLEAARGALEHAGVSADFIEGVEADSKPSTLSVSDPDPSDEESPVSRILRLVDVGPLAPDGDAARSPEIQELEREARLGISDGDVMVALVALASLETRSDPFDRLMVLVEDDVGLLVARQEFELAEEVARALVRVSTDADRDDAQRSRARAALDLLTSKTQIRQIVSVMRWHSRDTPEFEACERVLGVLGSHAISPLLEVLADEPDRGARKAIVELVSDVADEHTETLAAYLDDDRWYFVRNIVTILGASARPESGTYLERTLRHSDARVRRETIRALAGGRATGSEAMLAAALEDADAQNVQLAARHLGALGSLSAVPALHDVALGRGRGDRSHPARIEAVESLGRIGASDSAPVLESLSRARGLRSRSRARELSTAAGAALEAMSARDETEGVS